MSNCHCVAASFLKETGVAKDVMVGASDSTMFMDDEIIRVPQWLTPVLREICCLPNIIFTAGDARAAYLRVNPQHLTREIESNIIGSLEEAQHPKEITV